MANYVAYRPGYPDAMLSVFREEMGLVPGSRVADIGCGPGQSSIPFLDFGCVVIGVEPNEPMREAAKELLADRESFTVVDGSAQATGLEAESVDLVVAAQAFHWFDNPESVAEFERIIRPGGYAALIWNERRLDSTEFLRGYEKLLLEYGTDYSNVRHDNLGPGSLSLSLRRKIRFASFENSQVLDLEGMIGRLRSSSYTPAEGAEGFDEMIRKAEELFAEHNESGRITISYDTNVFYARY